MIDLNLNRTRLRAHLEAPPAADRLGDITDPRVATAHGRLCVRGAGRHDLFSLLKAALLERFSAVPRSELIRDLLVPLKNALGNASKHGNGGNPAKLITVELELTRKGALIAITDEGQGFDVALTFARFQNQEPYATNHGRGLRHYHWARSPVSFENDGRTVLLCFKPTMHRPDSQDAGESANPQFAMRTRRASGAIDQIRDRLIEHPVTPALDARWMQSHLPTAAPEFSQGHARIEACRVYAPRGRASDDCGIRYLLRVTNRDGVGTATRILTGRLHATAAAAAADFECAARLHRIRTTRRLLIPRPVAWFAAEPRLVLYDIDPWLNLHEYLAHRRSLKSVRHAAERAGEALAILHRSRLLGRDSELETPGAKLQSMIARGERRLRILKGGAELLDRFRACAEAVQRQFLFHRPRTPSPIHGAMGWDCIQYSIEGYFYLYRFESCQWSDPGLDLGGYAADLLRFTSTHYDESGYRACLDTLLGAYNQEMEQPMNAEELPCYIAFALIERLQQTQPHGGDEAEEWLAALETDLWGWRRPAGVGVCS